MYTLGIFLVFLSWRAIGAENVTVDNILDNLSDIDLTCLSDIDVGEFLESYGYPFENHEVVTEDGYILGVHRIPYGRNESSETTSKNKPVVLVMHGLGSSSLDFMILGSERSLPLMLADAGYDVWLGNNRGNTYSRKHLTLNPDLDSEFWDFSFHELGIYDVPATVDHILNATGQENISYVGIFEGTTEFFVCTSLKPEYNDVINSMVALSPAAYVNNIENELVQFLKDYFTVLDLLTNALHITEVVPHSALQAAVFSVICNDISPLQPVCIYVYFSLSGASDQLNTTTLSTIVQSHPGGSSIKQWKHYLQEVKSKKFRQYDYGLTKNILVYGQSNPPDYELSKVTAPVTLMSGGRDGLATAPDVNRLIQALPNVVATRVVENFSHNDFLFGINAPSLYEDVIEGFNELR